MSHGWKSPVSHATSYFIEEVEADWAWSSLKMFHVWDIFKSAWLAECSDIYTPARAQNVGNCCWRGPQESLSNFSRLSSYRMKKIRLGRLWMQTCSQYICVHSKDPNLSTLLYCSTRQLFWYWEVTHFKECITSYIIFFLLFMFTLQMKASFGVQMRVK